MTDETVPVTQADIAAAKEFAGPLSGWRVGNKPLADCLAQAFAHHRLAQPAPESTAALVEDLAALMRDAVDNAGDEGELRMAEGTYSAALDILAAHRTKEPAK